MKKDIIAVIVAFLGVMALGEIAQYYHNKAERYERILERKANEKARDLEYIGYPSDLAHSEAWKEYGLTIDNQK